MAGAMLQHQFPVSIVTDGQGLNITVVSYLDRLDFGLIADRELVPDLWDMADDLINEITVLKEATGVEWVVEPSPHYPRLGTPGSRPRGEQLSEEMSRSESGDAGATPAPAKKRAPREGGGKKAPAAKKAPAKKAPAKRAGGEEGPAAKKAPAARKRAAKKTDGRA